MLLSHRHQFLFVHIAKTGGTSVRKALSPYRWSWKYGAAQFTVNKLSQLTGHKLGCCFPRHSRIVAAQEMLPAEYFNQLFKFAFVRNPWDLQVSSFHHIKRERPSVMGGYSNFKDFMRWKLDPQRPYQYHIDTSMQLQTDYLIDLRGNLLVDRVGKYENIQADFDGICEHIGLKKIALPHKRKETNRKNYRDYYTDELAEQVGNYFNQDVTMLDYRF